MGRVDKLTISIITFLVVSFGFLFFELRVGFSQDKSISSESNNRVSSDMVTVAGRIVYDEYEKGDIRISWSKDNAPPETRPEIIEKPGEFLIRVPKGIGKIRIGAICKTSDQEPPVAMGLSKPIIVSSDDIKLDSLHLKKIEQATPLMTSYQGPTVEISGRVEQKDYKGGLIQIAVKREENYKKIIAADVAVKILSAPGDYIIRVPKGIGKVCICAFNIPTEDPKYAKADLPGTLKGEYEKNPLYIESTDINGVDIIISNSM